MGKPATPPPKPRISQLQHRATLEELERYKLLVDSVQDYAIFWMDPRGYIQSWNKGAEKTNGYKAGEIIGKHFSIFYPEEDQKAKKPQKELVIARKEGRVEDEGWRVRKDGTRFWSNVVITALFDESGKLTGFGKVTRNLTERKEHEDELHRANLQLTRQQDELRLLSDAKDEFISLASHQLRTPATAIKQLLGMILEGFMGDVPAGLRTPIQKSYDTNERLIGIINSLLKVAQIDAGKVVLKKTQLKLDYLVQDIVSEHQDTVHKRHQTLSHTSTRRDIIVRADNQYLRMAIENLIDNASKYTFEGGSIEVRTGVKEGSAYVAIKDTGVGMSDADLELLFEKFKRFTNDLSQRVSGSGLGLYWAKKVVELHEGKIKVQSKVGKGTTFTIYLPVRK
jgi:PAS domain S-box-containing protein